MAKIVSIPKPEISVAESRPVVPVQRFQERLVAARECLVRHGYDFFVVYGDRERAGDLHYLTGIDPRFEEGIFVLSRNDDRVILLGNENVNRADASGLDLQARLFQELSPQGQVRDQKVRLVDLLRQAGIEAGTKVGVVGGKSFSAGFVDDPERSFGAPAYLVDALREIVGADAVTNAQQLFVGPENGLRSINTAHEIAEAEYASSVSSVAVHAATSAIAVGSNSDQIAALLNDAGIQRSVHPMVNFGETTRYGVCSPSSQRAELGDAFQVAYGLKGSLTCRSGMIAHGPDDLDREQAEFFEALTLNYFDTMVAWYTTLRIGATGGEVFAAADSTRDSALFAFSLNPGHTLAFEEWLESPFAPGSSATLNSGLLVQGDIIPDYSGRAVGVNIEDGVALADEALRRDLATLYPQAHQRIAARRQYLSEVIGVDLDESVLPLSNTPLWHAPYILDPSRALTA